MLCIKVVRKAKGKIVLAEEAGREEDVIVHQASRGFQAAVGSGGFGELVKVEKIVERLVVNGRWSERLKRERKAHIAGREVCAHDID